MQGHRTNELINYIKCTYIYIYIQSVPAYYKDIASNLNFKCNLQGGSLHRIAPRFGAVRACKEVFGGLIVPSPSEPASRGVD